MKENIRKKKKISKIIVSLLLIIVLLIIMINLTNENKDYKSQLEYIISQEWNDEIYPEGMPVLLSAYKGEQRAINIGKSLYYAVTEVFPNYYENLKGSNNEEIKKYYKTHKDEIHMCIGNVAEDDFIKLINEINSINKEQLNLESFYIDTNEIIVKNGYLTSNLFIKYEGAEEISIKIQVLDYLKTNISSVKYYK